VSLTLELPEQMEVAEDVSVGSGHVDEELNDISSVSLMFVMFTPEVETN